MFPFESPKTYITAYHSETYGERKGTIARYWRYCVIAWMEKKMIALIYIYIQPLMYFYSTVLFKYFKYMSLLPCASV